MARPLAILHLVSLRNLGGRAATALQQARLLADRGHRVWIGCVPDSPVERAARVSGPPVLAVFRFRRGLHPRDFARDCRHIARHCRAHAVDVLHAHVSQDSWAGCLAARLTRPRPAVVRSRGVDVPIRPHVFNRLLHNALTDHLVVPAEVIYDHVRALPGFDPTKVTLLPDGVDTRRFSPRVDGSAVRRELGLAADAPLIVMLARFEAVKGHAVLFEALARLRATRPRTPLRVLCAGETRTPGALDDTVAWARAAGLGPEVVTIVGTRADTERLLAAADLAVLPSLGSEGSSRVALEAAASGTPIVASAVGCLPEVVADGTTGTLVPPGDAAALATALATLLDAPQTRARMADAARTRAETRYAETLMVDRLEAIYRQVTRDGAGPACQPAIEREPVAPAAATST